jgi:hypothetical protein
MSRQPPPRSADRAGPGGCAKHRTYRSKAEALACMAFVQDSIPVRAAYYCEQHKGWHLTKRLPGRKNNTTPSPSDIARLGRRRPKTPLTENQDNPEFIEMIENRVLASRAQYGDNGRYWEDVPELRKRDA